MFLVIFVLTIETITFEVFDQNCVLMFRKHGTHEVHSQTKRSLVKKFRIQVTNSE